MADKKLSPEEIARNLEIIRFARAWMKIAGLTQSRIAEIMQVSEPTVSKWLNGKQTMSGSQIVQLTEILEISVQALLTEPGDKEGALRVARMLAMARFITNEDMDAFEFLMRRKQSEPK